MDNLKLDYNNLENIENIEKHYINFKDGTKLHTDNFTLLGTFNNQHELEQFDKNVRKIFKMK